MSADKTSMLVGEYLRIVADREAEKATHAVLHGKGLPITSPFPGDAVRSYRASDSLVRLGSMLGAAGLTKDPQFSRVLTAAVKEIAEASIAEVLNDLCHLEKYGDGGPDPEFILSQTSGEPLTMTAVADRFKQSR